MKLVGNIDIDLEILMLPGDHRKKSILLIARARKKPITLDRCTFSMRLEHFDI